MQNILSENRGDTHSSQVHMEFLGQIIGHKGSLNKLKNIEIISNIFSDYNGMKLEINIKKKI